MRLNVLIARVCLSLIAVQTNAHGGCTYDNGRYCLEWHVSHASAQTARDIAEYGRLAAKCERSRNACKNLAILKKQIHARRHGQKTQSSMQGVRAAAEEMRARAQSE
jgi:hypothetical protein